MDDKVKRLLEEHKGDKDLTTEKAYIEPGWDWSEANLREWNLKGLKLSNLDEKANFEMADLGEANLQVAQLEGANLKGADLTIANLQKADLWGAHLQEANLWEAHLQGAELGAAHLQGAELGAAHLQGAYLVSADLQEAFLWSANLQKADLEGADLREAKFSENTVLHNVNLFQCRLENSTLKNAYKQLDKIVVQEKERKYSEAKEVYLMLKNYFRQEGMYDVSGKYYYREKLMETKCFKEKKEWGKWLGNQILHKIAGFGEKPLWVLGWWVFIIIFSSFIYFGLDGIIVGNNINYNPTFLETIYFSIVTFTTLGFGDLAPKPGIFQIFASMEALLGAIFMSMFIFVFARKMTR